MTLRRDALALLTLHHLRAIALALDPQADLPELPGPMTLDYLADWLALLIRAPRPAAPRPNR